MLLGQCRGQIPRHHHLYIVVLMGYVDCPLFCRTKAEGRMCVKKFWILYLLAAFLLSLGSVMMRCWEDGGLQNLKWWTGLHLAGWFLLAVVI